MGFVAVSGLRDLSVVGTAASHACVRFHSLLGDDQGRLRECTCGCKEGGGSRAQSRAAVERSRAAERCGRMDGAETVREVG